MIFYCLISEIDLAKYKSISSGFGVLLKEQGARGFFRGGYLPSLDAVLKAPASLVSMSSSRSITLTLLVLSTWPSTRL
jgi:hypothetical protein